MSAHDRSARDKFYAAQGAIHDLLSMAQILEVLDDELRPTGEVFNKPDGYALVSKAMCDLIIFVHSDIETRAHNLKGQIDELYRELMEAKAI